jgi:hypothetical protein
MKHREIIQTLNQLDLNSCSANDVRNNLRQLGGFGVMITTLHKGKKIIRARISEQMPFENISELSYKPQKFNTTYQRASTPLETMFYGSIIPEILGKSEPQTARITVAFELSEFLRDVNTVGEQDIVFSAWTIEEDIQLVTLIHHKDFERPTELSIQLQAEFEQFAKSNPEQKNSTIEISEFLGNEYAKLPIEKHTDYMHSAIYSQLVTEKFDGVIYPSVRMAGEGINVAIKPETVDDKLKFLGASECTIYKNKKAVFIGNNTQTTVSGNKIEFLPIQKKYLVTKDFGRKQVGLE